MRTTTMGLLGTAAAIAVSGFASLGLAGVAGPQIFITEYMYSGNGEEFIEITNLGTDPVDLTGWSYDDESRTPGTFDLSVIGVLAAGESAIITEDTAENFRAVWGLDASCAIAGMNEANIGRNDEINIYDAADQLVDRLAYGDEDFPGSIRTSGTSGWIQTYGIGQNDAYSAKFSVEGDVQGTVVSSFGDVGSPCSHVDVNCILLNEIRRDQPSTDTDEYVELAGDAGAGLDGLTLIVLGDSGDDSGIIEEALPLDGLVVPASGLFLIAEDDDTFGVMADLVVDINLETSDNVTFRLVQSFTGTIGDDLDAEDDCVMDATPWSAVLDNVAFIGDDGGDCTYGGPEVGPNGPFTPGHAYRCVPTGDWIVGAFDPVMGDDTPGAGNAECPATECTAKDVTFNELRTDQPDGDDDEYIELAGTPGTALDGLCIVIVGDQGDDGCGIVEDVISLDGQVIGESGLFLLAEDPDTFGASADLVTALDLENGDDLTFFLVCNCVGLIPGVDLDADDDNVLDEMPWDSIVDEFSIVGTDPDGDCVYSDRTVGPDGEFVPAHVFVCSDTGEFTVGPFDPALGFDTPGAENGICPPPCILIDVALSEIRLDQPGADDDEYFEITGAPGTTLDGVSLVVLGDTSGDDCGYVEEVVSLDGQVIGDSGVFLVAEDDDTLGVVADLVIGLDFENTDNRTFLLVCGFGASEGDDLDADDDGELDSMPWFLLHDEVALVGTDPEGDCVYSDVLVGPDGDFLPAHVYACPNKGLWQIGAFDPVGGDDTPGAVNPDCAVECLVEGVTINELRTDQPGGDDDEYIELAGEPGTVLDGACLVVIGDTGDDGCGVVEGTVDLDGQVIGASGLFLIAEDADTFGATADMIAELEFENGDNLSFFLVCNCTSIAADDDLDADDDGVLDAMPWDSILDEVAIVGTDPEGDCVYSDVLVGPNGTEVPAHVYVCLDTGDWSIGILDPAGVTDTPGAENLACLVPDCPEDFDLDGMVGTTDLLQLLAAWGPCMDCVEDLDGDGMVGTTDLLQLLAAWGPCDG